MKAYRNYKGQYTTRAVHERRVLRRFYVYVAGIAVMGVIGVLSGTQEIEYHAPHAEASYTQPTWDPCGLADVVCENEEPVQHAEASYTQPTWDPCGLADVVCENEEPVQHAIAAVSEALGRDVTDETKRRIKYLYERATEASVPFYDAVKTVYCESQWYSVKSRSPEESYGLSQIHLPSHGVTKEQALDPHFALDFLVDNWQDTKWYGYNRGTGACANGITINL